MPHRFRPFFIFLFFLYSSLAYCQKDFREGFLITNDNDTIRGYIEFQTNIKNAQLCLFKKDLNSKIQEFSPGDIAAYRIKGSKYYISKEVEISGKSEQVFLEYLLYGIANLYYVAIEQQGEYYFVEKEGKLYSLTDEPITITKDGKVYKRESSKFKGSLKFLFKEADNMNERIENASFDHKSMIKLAKNYHNQVCDDFSCVVYEKSTKTPFYIEPRIGYLSARMGMRSSEDFVIDKSYIIGAHFSFNSLKFKDTWRFTLGLNFANLNFKEQSFYIQNVNPNNAKEWLVQSSYQFLEIPLMVKYTLFSGKLQPYILVGGELVYIINPKFSYSLLAGTRRAETEQFRKIQIGFVGGAGIRSKLNDKLNIFTEANYSYRNPALNIGGVFDNHHVNSIAIYVGLDIRMNRE